MVGKGNISSITYNYFDRSNIHVLLVEFKINEKYRHERTYSLFWR